MGEAGVVLQRYSPSKGGKPWICRALVDARAAANLQWKLRRGEENTKIDAGPWAHGGGQPEAWVLSESSQEEVATSTARCVEGTCSVVRSVPGSQAWTDAKVCAASVLRGLNHVLGNQLQAIACDCVKMKEGAGPCCRSKVSEALLTVTRSGCQQEDYSREENHFKR